MKFNVIRMPDTGEKIRDVLDGYAAFLDAMYPKEMQDLLGAYNFQLDYWLFLWEQGAGYFVEGVNADGVQILAMLTQHQDLWHGRSVLTIQRIASARHDEQTVQQMVDEMVDYIISIAPLLRVDFVYHAQQFADGSEMKNLVWSN